MVSSGNDPFDDDEVPTFTVVPKDRIEAHKRLMEEGGVDAVIVATGGVPVRA